MLRILTFEFFLFVSTVNCQRNSAPSIQNSILNGDADYKGDRVNGLPHGSGTLIYPRDDPQGRFNYTGDFNRGRLNGRGNIFWKNGASYSGDIVNNILNGEGEYRWANGDSYLGTYVRGRRNGVGDMEYADGDSYRGSWRNGKYHGQGEYRWTNGNRYVGDWKDGVADGTGEFTYGSGLRTGEKYNGQFRNGLKHGFGVYTYPGGETFEGNYKDGKRDGMGTLFVNADRSQFRRGIWRDGIYVGQTLDDLQRFSGDFFDDSELLDDDEGQTDDEGNSDYLNPSFGNLNSEELVQRRNSANGNIQREDEQETANNNFLSNNNNISPQTPDTFDTRTELMRFENGVYRGSLQNGRPHGIGMIVYTALEPDLRNYTGGWRFGAKFGEGEAYFKSGDRYRGDWLDNLQHGQGVYRWADSNGNPLGHRYIGEFRSGVIEGRGTFENVNGNEYRGEFRNGLPDGEGEFSYGSGDKSGDKYAGLFQNGAFHGRGRYFFANGDRYEGNFVNGERSGEGVMFYMDGSRREGRWENDRLTGRASLTRADGSVESEFFSSRTGGQNLTNGQNPAAASRRSGFSPLISRVEKMGDYTRGREFGRGGIGKQKRFYQNMKKIKSKLLWD